MMFPFTGMIAPTLAPLHNDGSLNTKIIPKYADHLIKTGVGGIYVNGTSGEGMSMTVAERKEVAEGWVNASASRGHSLKVVVMVGAGCLKDTQDLAAHAEGIGADAIATLPCLYDKPETIEDLVDYCLEVSKMAPKTPLLYYHIPFRTGVNLPMDLFLKKGGEIIGTLKGLKFTSHDLDEGLRCLELCDGKFTIFSGFDVDLTRKLSLGFSCAINASFNFLGPEAANIFRIVEEGKRRRRTKGEEGSDEGERGRTEDWMDEANKQQEIIDKTLERIFSITNGFSVAAAKVAMKILTGLEVGPPRKPLRPLSDDLTRVMEDSLRPFIEGRKLK